MDKDRIYIVLDLFLKSWNGTLNRAEEEELGALLAEPRWVRLKRNLESDRFIMARFKEYGKYNSAADFSVFLKQVRRREKSRHANTWWRRVIASAACAAICVAAGWWWSREAREEAAPGFMADSAVERQVADRNSVRLVLSDNQVITLSKKTEIIPISRLDSIGVSRSAGVPTLDYTRLKKELLTDTVVYHTLIVPRGEMQSVILSDGSRVVVNAMSMLKYPVVFPDSTREVYVEGEAKFEVARDGGRSFVVSGKDFQVDVLGTVFNVMSYDEEPVSLVTLLEGKVRASSGDRTVILKPGEQVSITPDHDTRVSEVDAEAVVAWVDKKINFDAERLDAVMRKLCRWYDVRVLYETPAMRERRFTGMMMYDVPLEMFLEWLSTTTDMRFTLSDGVIVVAASGKLHTP